MRERHSTHSNRDARAHPDWRGNRAPLAAGADLDIITVAVYIDRQAKMSDLTPRQTQILRLIQRFISDTGMPPTRAEIAHELGLDRKSTRLNSSHLVISYA